MSVEENMGLDCSEMKRLDFDDWKVGSSLIEEEMGRVSLVGGDDREMMKKRRVEQSGWEELPYDILVNIFKRIDAKILFKTAYAVCHSWRLISRLRVFFKQESMVLDFTIFRYISGGEEEADTFMRLLKSVLVDVQSCKPITRLNLPDFVHLSDHHLCYLAHHLPNLRTLRLPHTTDMITPVGFSMALQLWKEMRLLSTGPIETQPNYVHVIREIGINCKDLYLLSLSGSELDPDLTLHLDECTSQLIAHHLPNLRILILRDCVLYQQGLENIMNQCTGLHVIKIVNCKHAHNPKLSPQAHTSYLLRKRDTPETPIQWSMASHPAHPFYLSASDLITQFLW